MNEEKKNIVTVHEKMIMDLGNKRIGQYVSVILQTKAVEKTKSFLVLRIDNVVMKNSRRIN